MSPDLTERLFNDEDVTPLDPFDVFEDWFELARDNEPHDPHAMALATVDAEGDPDVRMVLLNQRDRRGFSFFTNFESDKGRQLLAHRSAAMVMHWKSIRRQIRIRGPVDIVSADEADAYFASRGRGSQIASSASRQSRLLTSREQLTREVADLAAGVGNHPVPRPPHWSGFRILPVMMEFWRDGEHRLHDRVRFTRATPVDRWIRRRLYP